MLVIFVVCCFDSTLFILKQGAKKDGIHNKCTPSMTLRMADFTELRYIRHMGG